MSFDGKVVLVTGAAGNVGRAVASHFFQGGASLILLDRENQRLEGAFDGKRCVVAAADLLDASAVSHAVAGGVERFGSLDVLCHIAGAFRMGEAVHETQAATWDFLMDVNARSFIHVARAAVPVMVAKRSGKVVTVGASSAGKGLPAMGAYCASKAALARLTEAMSSELRDKNINVNCVLPTIIDTPENRQAMPDADHARWVATEALADVIGFLASESSRAMHGASVPVSGLS